MAINPATATFLTADLLRNTAVQLVDVNAPGLNGETSAEALVVVTATGAAQSASLTQIAANTAISTAWTGRSGTITTGGTSQTLMAANAARRGFWVQNVSAENLWINDGPTANAGQPSIKLAPNAMYESPDLSVATGAISIFGATTGSAFSSREW